MLHGSSDYRLLLPLLLLLATLAVFLMVVLLRLAVRSSITDRLKGWISRSRQSRGAAPSRIRLPIPHAGGSHSADRVDHHARWEVRLRQSLWYDLMRRTQAQSLGEGWVEMIHPDDQALCLDRWQHSVRTGEAFEMKYRMGTLPE